MFLVEEVQKLDRSQRWNYTFQVLNLETRKIVEDFTLKAARLPEHRNLNRYRDVLPYDHSRIELKDGETDYINGNLVEVKDIGRKYILTQGPLPDTCSHFWQMIWEQNTTAIIMLNKVIEKNTVKCHPYWPMGEDEVLELGDYTIKNVSERAEAAYVVRDLQLEHVPSGESRDIKQFHYMLWPDFGVPSKPETFLEFLYDIRESGVFDPEQGPPVIHCSAGIGRSGTFCLVDSVLEKAEKDGKPDNIDIKGMLLHLRSYRVGLVQTPEQLRFSYVAIIQGIVGLFPEAFQVEESENEESHKRKAEDEEPPPIPPRKRAPPAKPPRQHNTEETTAAEESLKQKKMVKNLQDGIVESSDGESGSEDEVIDLSASEEEEESRDEVVELYETDEEENGDCHDPGVPDRPPPPIPDRSFPVDKPLPQLPPEDDCDIELNSQESASLVGPSSVENSEDVAVNVNLKASERGSESPREEEGGVVGEANEEGETERGEMGEKSPKLLPIFSFEEEEESLNQDVPNHSSKVIENTVSDKNDAIHTEGNCQREKSNDTHLNSDIDNRSDTSQSTKKNENVLDGTVTRETDDKAREDREIRQRRRRDEKNKQTAEMIEKIKRNMQEREIAAARNKLYKKSFIALGISVTLLIGYYWVFG